MRQDWDTYFISLAKAASTRATCPKRHVGAVLVDPNNHILSTGYNGTPPGEDHCMDVGCLEVNGFCQRVIHAEPNAIKRVGWWKRRHSKLYITHFPCFDCAKLVVKSGIVEVIYEHTLKRSPDDVIALFNKEGIAFRQHTLLSGAMAAQDSVKVEVIGSNPI